MINWKCSYCGANEYFIGKQDSYAVLTKGLKSQPVKHEVCLKCGTINRSYIDKPEKFTKYKEE